ncbi:hypothetical protein [Pantoea phytobeneficialis]|uniref:hypothetical protein n=1 Tax=Pantoea phytobeneficialis TaxID=2052056 RepID=UPI0026E1C851|nr:hypothetical protein [Pantoea phytobeneficialis]
MKQRNGELHYGVARLAPHWRKVSVTDTHRSGAIYRAGFAFRAKTLRDKSRRLYLEVVTG